MESNTLLFNNLEVYRRGMWFFLRYKTIRSFQPDGCDNTYEVHTIGLI